MGVLAAGGKRKPAYPSKMRHTGHRFQGRSPNLNALHKQPQRPPASSITQYNERPEAKGHALF
jgi:hypothetical protein